MSEIVQQRLQEVRQRIAQAAGRSGRSPDDVTIVAVTKTVSTATAAVLPTLGVLDLGENRPQELWKKAPALPQVRWHLIGHLQRNKIERTVPLTTLIHSVDSLRLLNALHAFGQQRGQPVHILLQFNCSREPSKQGFAPAEVDTLAEQLPGFTGVVVRGVMTMAAFTADPQQVRPTFVELRQLRDRLQQRSGLPLPHLSMGMSNDFEVAIEEGATLVRLGTILFAGLENTTHDQ
ncbi:MAG: YggS family pyridoxal phosphate-dependent enzyme [Gemmataceae bacterium]|nr:YggS family pyridoxal phosphate-dependent enzyme [Gemmataceae bacterium]MDW8241842.1 YggS family pyridoxal phosphate-dependent enzyme [Thermogemmata sp.]